MTCDLFLVCWDHFCVCTSNAYDHSIFDDITMVCTSSNVYDHPSNVYLHNFIMMISSVVLCIIMWVTCVMTCDLICPYWDHFFCVYVKCVWSIFDNITMVCTSNACYDHPSNVYVDVSGRLILKRMMDPSKKVIKKTTVVIVSMMIIHTSLLWTVNYNTLFVFILYHIYSVHKLYLQHTHIVPLHLL